MNTRRGIQDYKYPKSPDYYDRSAAIVRNSGANTGLSYNGSTGVSKTPDVGSIPTDPAIDEDRSNVMK